MPSANHLSISIGNWALVNTSTSRRESMFMSPGFTSRAMVVFTMCIRTPTVRGAAFTMLKTVGSRAIPGTARISFFRLSSIPTRMRQRESGLSVRLRSRRERATLFCSPLTCVIRPFLIGESEKELLLRLTPGFGTQRDLHNDRDCRSKSAAIDAKPTRRKTHSREEVASRTRCPYNIFGFQIRSMERRCLRKNLPPRFNSSSATKNIPT
jgi:hypothetical protein